MSDCILTSKGNTRAWYIKLCGPLPPDVHVLHKCDRTKCRNLDHIFLGSRKDNMQDMVNKGRNEGWKPGQAGGSNRGVKQTEKQKKAATEANRKVDPISVHAIRNWPKINKYDWARGLEVTCQTIMRIRTNKTLKGE